MSIDWFSYSRPSRPQALALRIRRLYFHLKSSYPYLSGNGFAKLAELIIDKKFLLLSEKQKNQKILNKNIVFCPSPLLQPFLMILKNLFTYTKTRSNVSWKLLWCCINLLNYTKMLIYFLKMKLLIWWLNIIKWLTIRVIN